VSDQGPKMFEPAIRPPVDIAISENGRQVLQKRYLRKGPDGKPIEDIEGMFRRVAHAVAEPDAAYGYDASSTEDSFYGLLASLRFFPNSPTFTGAGTPLGQLAACFVMPISDDLGKKSDGIFQTLRDAALIQQTGGGNGFSFSKLRPKGDSVASSAGVASGPVGFLRVYDTAFGEVAQGGCLLPDTLVFTSAGLLRLDEIVDPEINGWQAHQMKVASANGWQTSPRGYNNGVAPVLRVHTREGVSLAGTPQHRVQVMTDEGPVWRELAALQPGDWMLVRMRQQQGQVQELRRPVRQHGNQDWPTLPATLDEELAFFLGYLTGDGFVASREDDHRVGVSVSHDSYLMTEMPTLLDRLFGIRVNRQQKPNDASVTMVLDNRAVKEFLQLNGLTKARSRDAAVPRLIRQSPPAIISAYLRGLFEADGTLVHGYPGLTTTSTALAEQVATLLIGLGCPVRLRSVVPGLSHYGKAVVHHVMIRSAVGLQAWRARIGCDARSRFTAANDWQSDLARESSYPLPCPRYWLQPLLDAITLEQIDARGRGLGVNFRSQQPRLRRAILRYYRSERSFTRSAYDQLTAAYPELAGYVRPIDDQWFVQVAGVTPLGEHLTLDLEVDETHAYLANGVVTHNTRRGANMAVLRVDHPDIEQFITCKAQEGQIANFNISVGITDAFMQAVADDTDFALINPRDGALWRTVRARDLFDKMVTYAHRNGEPGALFLDAANRANPVPHLYELEATNPCITAETWVHTEEGPRQVSALIGRPFAAVVNGRPYTSDARGFWSTGVKDIYELRTTDGLHVRLTGNHPLLRVDELERHDETTRWVEAAQLQPGDRVKLHDHRSFDCWTGTGSYTAGWLLGLLTGDGTFSAGHGVLSFWGAGAEQLSERALNMIKTGYKARSDLSVQRIAPRDEYRVCCVALYRLAQTYGIGPGHKTITDAVEAASSDFCRGFLQGLFDTDGSVQDGGEKGLSVRLAQSDLELLERVQRMLLRLGIHSVLYASRRDAHMTSLPDGRGGRRLYATQPQHELVISKDNLEVFVKGIGFSHPEKSTHLAAALAARRVRGPYRERFVAEIESIISVGQAEVFDCAIPEAHAFDAQGFMAHNCGEQWLGPNENCCLGSINLAQHITPAGGVDWDKLCESAVVSTRFLDDVVDANKYVPAVPQLKEAAHRARRIGLGIMGLGDLMYAVGVRYGSPEAQELAGQVMEFVRFHSMRTSVALAKERGPFPAIRGSIYDPENLRWQPPTPLAPLTHDWGRPALDWAEIVQGILQHGIRNAAQTTVAPTGTIGTVAACEGYGCEPVFALAYTRTVKDGIRDLKLTYTSPLFTAALQAAGLDEVARERISEEVSLTGSCQGVAGVPEAIRHTFVVSSDITAEEHVRMQAAIQAFVDNSISKCLTGDTLVLTAQGLVPIAELSEMRLPDQFEPLNEEVITPAGLERSDAFYYGGMRETRHIRLSYGYEINGTPNHRVHVLTADGTIQFAYLDDLKIGDTVVLYSGQQITGSGGQTLPMYCGEHRTNSKSITFPERMSPELAYILGCITSEGNIGANGVYITNGDYALLEHLGQLFTQVFGLRWYICKDERRESVYTLQVNSRALRNWLLADLGMAAGARNKIIPTCILRASREEIVAFWRGLFLDGYMIENGRMFGIGLASRALLQQLQIMFLNFGITSRINRAGEHAWALTVAGSALERLGKMVEFDEHWKTDRIARRDFGRQHRLFTYTELMPQPLTEALRRMQTASGHSLRSLYSEQTPEYQRARVDLLQSHRLDRTLASTVYQHFQDTPDPYAQTFFAHDAEGCIYVDVESIESDFAEVFDLSMPGSHSFIANGLGNHNTINFPSTATIDDVKQAYQLAWQLGCKGLTVYVTGSRQEVVLETKATADQKTKPGEGAGASPAAESAAALMASAPAPTTAPALLPVSHPPVTVHAPALTKRPRPSALAGVTYRKETPLGTAFVTVNVNGDSQPFEVFLNVGKAGSDVAAVAEALGRLISLILRLPSPLATVDRLGEVIDQLAGIGGGRSMGFGAKRVRSLPDAVAQVLREHVRSYDETDEDETGEEGSEASGQPVAEQLALPISDRPIGDLCPDCGQATFIPTEGCKKCYVCGYSEC
jgi:ribonucleoside-diphosphate reductase alpha chain